MSSTRLALVIIGGFLPLLHSCSSTYREPKRRVGLLFALKEGRKGAGDFSKGTAAVSGSQKGLFFGHDLKLIWPLRGKITSYFGRRGRRFHYGIDIAARRGTPIRAAAAGKVITSRRLRGYGRVIKIDHGDYTSVYAHCLKLLVSRGAQVKSGQRIALVGRSGRASGYHLHFEYRNSKGKALNPLYFLRTDNLISALGPPSKP